MPMPKDLSPKEQEVVTKAKMGEAAILSEPPTPKQLDDPAFVAKMPVVRAEVIRVLCLGEEEKVRVHSKGVQITGACISDPLDFEFTTLLCPLVLCGCWLGDTITVKYATTKSIFLFGTHAARGMNADGADIKGDVFLRDGFMAKDAVHLLGAKIGGQLDLSGAHLEAKAPDHFALKANQMNVTGGVFLSEGFTAKGGISLLRAKIGGDLSLEGASLENPNGHVLFTDQIDVMGDVDLARVRTKGEIRLLGAKIGGDLSLEGASLENPNNDTLSADKADIRGSVFLSEGFTAKGGISLLRAKIGTSLYLNSAHLEADNLSLRAEGVNITGSAFLSEGFTAKGGSACLVPA